MAAPCVVFDEAAQFLASKTPSGNFFLTDHLSGGSGEPTNVFDSVYYRLQIVLRLVGAFVKIVEVDVWGISWIGRSQSNRPTAVLRVSLKDVPSEVVVAVPLDPVRVAGKIARKAVSHRKDKQVRQWALWCGSLDYGERDAV